MKLRLYQGQSCWVVVPEFLLPPSPTARYEPLRFAGFMEADDLKPTERLYIKNELARRYFAAIPDDAITRFWPRGQSAALADDPLRPAPPLMPDAQSA